MNHVAIRTAVVTAVLASPVAAFAQTAPTALQTVTDSLTANSGLVTAAMPFVLAITVALVAIMLGKKLIGSAH